MPRCCLCRLTWVWGMVLASGLSWAATLRVVAADPPTVREPVVISTPLSPPHWALLERELLRQNEVACREFYQRYFDERGWLQCVERWGGDDGPDDAIENLLDWPLVHALGGSDDILQLTRQAWEGHLRQYTQARTVDVPLARDGMYYKEFPVMMDWLHNAEGLVVFNLLGLSDPRDLQLIRRTRRYAGFYLNEDPGAPNFDPQHQIIRSLFNGSRGPLLRPATALDWAGDPIEVAHRFRPKHGETSYEQMLEHFREYTETLGDHPQNLKATTLALNAFLLTGEDKYRRWLLAYVDAWGQRMLDNHDIIPTNIGLDGRPGSAAGGRWWGGVYGWGFTVLDPATGKLAHRNQHHAGLQGFLNAYLLTGDDRYLDSWRRQIAAVNAQGKTVEGRTVYPRMYGAQGWYDFVPEKYSFGALEIAWLTQRPSDLAAVAHLPWQRFLRGEHPDFPVQALQADLARIRRRVDAMRRDDSTPDTRLADDPLEFNPASVESLVTLAWGGLLPGRSGSAMFCTLRYFDPHQRRAGLPADVAALIDEVSAEQIGVTLVNCSQLAARDVVLQAGGYAEHRIAWVQSGADQRAVDAPSVCVRLSPGAGGRLVLKVRRFAQPPTLAFPPGL